MIQELNFSPICVSHVNVFIATVAPPMSAADEERQSGYLDDEELARWRSFSTQKLRDEFLTAHALLRTSLSYYASVDPKDWRFCANSNGRPQIAEPAVYKAIDFNLSHTDGLVAAIIAQEREVGVDVENINRNVEPLELAQHCFSRTEVASLVVLPEFARRNRFFDFWTLKEAYIKARGVGLSLPLDSFSFVISANGASIAFDECCSDDPSRWQFALFSPTCEHRLAVAVSSNVKGLDCIRIHRIDKFF